MKDDPIASRKLTVLLFYHREFSHAPNFQKVRDSWALLPAQVMFLKHEQSPFSCNCAEYRKKNPTFFWAGKESMHSSSNIFMEAKWFFLMPHKTFQAAIHSFLSSKEFKMYNRSTMEGFCQKTAHNTNRNLKSFMSIWKHLKTPDIHSSVVTWVPKNSLWLQKWSWDKTLTIYWPTWCWWNPGEISFLSTRPGLSSLCLNAMGNQWFGERELWN